MGNTKLTTGFELENKKDQKILELQTKLKNAQYEIEKLKNEKQWIERITSISPSIITVFDRRKKINTFQNRSLLKKLGYTGKEIEKYSAGKVSIKNSLIHPEDVDKNDGSIYDFDKMKDNETHTLEFRIKDSNGNWQWIRKSSAVLSRNKYGKPEEIISTNDIITEQKTTEKELLEREEKFRSVFENAHDVIIIVDKFGKIKEINGKVEDFIGIKRDKVIGKSFFSLGIFKAKDLIKLLKDFRQSVKTGRLANADKTDEYVLTELKIHTANGEEKFIAANTSVLRKNNKVTGFLSIIHDITRRKKAEEEIKSAHELLEKITSASPSIITVFDLNKKINIFENKSLLKSLGYKDKAFELIENLPLYDKLNAIIHPEDLPKVKSFYKKVRKIKDNLNHEMEFRIKDYWGSWKWFRRVTCSFKRNSKGIVEQIISIFENITEKKSSEDVIKKSEEFNRAISQNAPIGISVRSTTGRLLSYNRAWKNIWAKTDKSIFEDMTKERKELVFDEHDKYLSKWKEQVKKVYQEGGSLYIPELRTNTKKSGKAGWVSNYFYAIKDSEGKVDRVVILTVDITERKRAELELLETKQLLEKITATSPAIIAVSDLNKVTNIYQNRSILEMLGYSAEEIQKLTKKQSDLYIKLVHQDDVSRLREFDGKIDTLKDNVSYEIEYRLKDNTNNWQWIRRVCRVFQRDQNGMPSQMVSIFENINESKKAEEALKESERTAQALINTITESVFMIDTTGKILTINDTAAQRIGKSKENLIGKCIFDMFPEPIGKQREQKLIETIKFKKPIRHIDERNGKYFDTLGYPVFDKNNRIHKIIVFAKDITEQVAFEKVLRESEERYRNLIESSPDGIIVHMDGKMVFANKSSAKILGYAGPDELLGRNVMEFLHPDFNEEVIKRINQIIKRGENVPFIEEKFRKVDGSYIDVEVSAQPYHFKGKTAVQVIVRDISFRKETEKALIESEERYRTFIEKSTEGIYRLEFEKPVDITLDPVEQIRLIYKHCRFEESNDVMAAMYGFKNASEIVGKRLYDLITEPGRPEGNKELLHFIKSNYKMQNFETRENVNGKTKYFINNAAGTVENGHLIRIWGTQTDSTDLKERGEEIRKLSRAVNQSPASVIITDVKGDIEYVNPKFTEVTGYTFDEVIGKNPRILKSGDRSREEYKDLWDTITSGNEWQGEFLNIRKNGEKFWEFALITPIKSEDGTISNFLAIKQDITGQKQIDEKLKQSLKEKEVMLREIHHRVKNNLQIISSLLKLQSGYTKDPVASEYLQISQNRVKTMALIHQQLYRSDDLSGIDFKEYMKLLAKNLFQAYGINENDIRLSIIAEDVLLSIDKAIPCGLIVNELVSNSLKHAFKKLKDGKIYLEIVRAENEYIMTIKDNGKGIPGNIDYQNTQTLGMQLVMTLVEQLDGKIKMENTSGTAFIISFPAEE